MSFVVLSPIEKRKKFMTKRNTLQPGRRTILSLVATIAALCLMLTTSLTTLASTVRISDPVGVVNVNHFTDAVIAAIQSLESSLGGGSAKGGSISGFGLALLIGGIVALILIVAVVRFIKRLLGFGGRPASQPVQVPTQNQPQYGD